MVLPDLLVFERLVIEDSGRRIENSKRPFSPDRFFQENSSRNYTGGCNFDGVFFSTGCGVIEQSRRALNRM
jgi:hypothetical protein